MSPPMSLLEAYLSELRGIRAGGGVPETSGYPALARLLDAIGEELRPPVRCLIHPSDQGAGIPHTVGPTRWRDDQCPQGPTGL